MGSNRVFCGSSQTGGAEVPKQGVFSSESRLLMSESRCLGREVPVFSEKEVSICSERRKQVEKMLTSFWNISICFPSLHIL